MRVAKLENKSGNETDLEQVDRLYMGASAKVEAAQNALIAAFVASRDARTALVAAENELDQITDQREEIRSKRGNK